MPGPLDNYTFGSNKAFENHFNKKHLAGQKMPFPGVKRANEYFMDGNPQHAVVGSEAEQAALLKKFGY